MSRRSPVFARYLTCVAFLLFFAVCRAPAHATGSSSGIDTPSGVTTLPLSVEGNQMMNIQSNGGVSVGADYAGNNPAPNNGAIIEGPVGIGVTSPGAGVALDVNGGIRGSSSAIAVNATCPSTAEGTFGYDSLAHKPVYCSGGHVWTALASAAGFTVVTNSVTNMVNASVSASCAGVGSGTLIGGGGSCPEEGGWFNAVNGSYPSGNSWVVQCQGEGRTWASPAVGGATAYAFCQ